MTYSIMKIHHTSLVSENIGNASVVGQLGLVQHPSKFSNRVGRIRHTIQFSMSSVSAKETVPINQY